MVGSVSATDLGKYTMYFAPVMLYSLYWAGGEIGRRTALRTRRRKAWRFESSPAHKSEAIEAGAACLRMQRRGLERRRDILRARRIASRGREKIRLSRRILFVTEPSSAHTDYLPKKFAPGSILSMRLTSVAVSGSMPKVFITSAMMP
jgi:hypothetical protein